jgi:hypothetical protein
MNVWQYEDKRRAGAVIFLRDLGEGNQDFDGFEGDRDAAVLRTLH